MVPDAYMRTWLFGNFLRDSILRGSSMLCALRAGNEEVACVRRPAKVADGVAVVVVDGADEPAAGHRAERGHHFGLRRGGVVHVGHGLEGAYARGGGEQS